MTNKSETAKKGKKVKVNDLLKSTKELTAEEKKKIKGGSIIWGSNSQQQNKL